MRPRSIGLRATLALGSAFAGHTAIAAAPTPPPSPADARPAARADEDSPRRTADELLRALRRSKPLRDLVVPASGTHRASKAKPRALLPEGTVIVDWEGYLTKNGTWWTIAPQTPEGEPPTKILPNINLEIMTRSMAGKATPIRFSVSGEMTAFQGQNYLLARFIRRVVPTADPPRPVSADADSDAETNGVPPPPAEDVIAMLRNRQPRTVVPAATRPAGSRLTGNLPGPSVRPDGSAFAQRPGRITRDEQWWNFAFETDHPDSDEPMIRLLPGRGLELMIRITEETRDGLVLLVSGELTQFRGENYLLPRGVLRRSGADNLRK